mmetsp:Transcript_60734/g.188699  ORF Transcript_60734/g.188699 Transcript_60734/m.188699 type:complete len:238 (-) Transcript_60734:890-1603(-)
MVAGPRGPSLHGPRCGTAASDGTAASPSGPRPPAKASGWLDEELGHAGGWTAQGPSRASRGRAWRSRAGTASAARSQGQGAKGSPSGKGPGSAGGGSARARHVGPVSRTGLPPLQRHSHGEGANGSPCGKGPGPSAGGDAAKLGALVLCPSPGRGSHRVGAKGSSCGSGGGSAGERWGGAAASWLLSGSGDAASGASRPTLHSALAPPGEEGQHGPCSLDRHTSSPSTSSLKKSTTS